MAGKDVLVMQPEAWMSGPAWFLVAGLAWPEGQANAGLAEAAFAIAPDVTKAVRPVGADGKPVLLGRHFALMLDAGSQCAAALGKRVVFLSDITLWLSDLGSTWKRVGVDFATAQNELERQPLGLYLTVSSRAYTILCSTTRKLTLYYTSGGTAEVPPEERELVRANFEARLDADWPGYITKILASAQPAAGRNLTYYPRANSSVLGDRAQMLNSRMLDMYACAPVGILAHPSASNPSPRDHE